MDILLPLDGDLRGLHLVRGDDEASMKTEGVAPIKSSVFALLSFFHSEGDQQGL
jgi:hypothetical protein